MERCVVLRCGLKECQSERVGESEREGLRGRECESKSGSESV